jgi:hypothetical protein
MESQPSPLSRARVQQIRGFEQRQADTIAGLVRDHVHVLERTQALALNVVHEALEQPQSGDASTPVFFLTQTAADSLRVAELALSRGYGTAAVQCSRDALEAEALALLLAKEPARAERYWEGAELSPGTVRTELQRCGLDEDVVRMMWGLYDLMSLFAHPNVERLAFVMDEADKGEGDVLRTFRAGGTTDPAKLHTFANLCVSAAGLVAMLIPETFGGYLPAARVEEYRNARNDVLRTVMEPLRAVLARAAARREEHKADPAADQHARRLRRRIPAMDTVSEATNNAKRPKRAAPEKRKQRPT